MQKHIKTEHLRKRFLVKKPLTKIKSLVLKAGKITEKKSPIPEQNPMLVSGSMQELG